MLEFFDVFDIIINFFSGLFSLLTSQVELPSAVSSLFGVDSISFLGLLSINIVAIIIVASIVKLLPLA